MKESEINTFLREIADGKIMLTPTKDPQRVYAGNVFYDASNGWAVVLFNDCNAWDYVDCVIVNGERTDTEFTWDRENVSDEDAWRIWRIPGYLTWRCHGCGEIIDVKEIDPDDPSQDWKRCNDCSPEDIDKSAHAPMPKKWELSKSAQDLLKRYG